MILHKGGTLSYLFYVIIINTKKMQKGDINMTDNRRFVTTAWQIMDALQNEKQLENTLSNSIDILCNALPCLSGIQILSRTTKED